MPSEYISSETAEALGMDDVETSADLQRGRDREGEHSGQSIGSPGWDSMKVDSGCAVAVNSIRKHMDLMLPCESRG
jgi:hypothetical protein